MPLSLPLPRLGLDPSSAHHKPHLRQAVALSQSLYELVHLPQLPIKSHHSLIEPPVLRPEPFDFIGLTLPCHYLVVSAAHAIRLPDKQMRRSDVRLLPSSFDADQRAIAQSRGISIS